MYIVLKPFLCSLQNSAPEPPEQDTAVLSETDHLLAALRTKASAFSDDGWNSYWQLQGPPLLSHGWESVYPDIPLSRVRELCSLPEQLTISEGQSCSVNRDEVEDVHLERLTLESKDTLPFATGQQDATTKNSAESQSDEVVTCNGGGVAVETSGKTNTVSSDTGEVKEVHLSRTPPGSPSAMMTDEVSHQNETESMSNHKDESENTSILGTERVSPGASSAISDVEIQTMWSNHYNQYYWYCYQLFQQQVTERGVEERGKVGTEESKV